MTGDDLEVEAVDDVGLPDRVTVSMKVEKSPIEIPGSDRRECLSCGEDVIVSPATVRSIEAGIYPDDVACLECANAAAESAEK